MALRKIAYFGTDCFSSRVLCKVMSALPDLDSPLAIDIIVPDSKVLRSGGRKRFRTSPVEELGQEHGAVVHHWTEFKNYALCRNKSLSHPYDVGVVVSFGHMIPTSLISCFPRGCINVHPSLLPQWRGPSPIQHAILSGQDRTGVTLLELSEDKFDAGKILMQREYCIPPRTDFAYLSEALADMAGDMLLATLQDLPTFQQSAWPQDEAMVTVAGKIAKSMGNLAVETTSVAQCMRLYRALGDQIGVWVQFRGRRLRLVQLEEMGHEEGAWDAPGASQEVGNLQYLGDCKKIALCLKDGRVGVRKVQLQGRRPITAEDFHNAYLTREGAVWKVSKID